MTRVWVYLGLFRCRRCGTVCRHMCVAFDWPGKLARRGTAWLKCSYCGEWTEHRVENIKIIESFELKRYA